MTFTAAILARSRMTEDGLLLDNDDARRLVGIAKAVEDVETANRAVRALPRWGRGIRDERAMLNMASGAADARLNRIATALADNNPHALDQAIADPPRQEIKR